MKNILIIGGTNFVGRNIAEFLVRQENYKITLFNRGVTNPTIFPRVKRIKGDRNRKEDIKEALGSNWDFIIDVSAYIPYQLDLILNEDLSGLKNYIFISTCSVYDNDLYQKKLRDETAPVLSCSKEQETDKSLTTYGNRKAACEKRLKNSGVPSTIFRPALIYGKYDPTDRFYYWLHQVKKKKETILPEAGVRLFSVTYIDDLVMAINQTIEQNITNQIFNCISTPTTSIAGIVKACESELQKGIEKVTADIHFLNQNNIAQWTDIPLWLNSDIFTFSNKKILKTLSLKLTKLEKGIKLTNHYYKTLNYPTPKYGIDEMQQKNLINKIKNHQ